MSNPYLNILTKEQCNTIANSMLLLKEKEKLNVENDTTYYYNSLGITSLPEADALLSLVEPIIKQDNSNIVFENSYTRIYQNGSKLGYHTDRPDLYLTLSICVYSDIDNDWPLCVSNIAHEGPWNFDKPFEYYAQDYNTYVTSVGSGVTCVGIKYPHWREPLICKEDQMVIQTFYHWNLITI